VDGARSINDSHVRHASARLVHDPNLKGINGETPAGDRQKQGGEDDADDQALPSHGNPLPRSEITKPPRSRTIFLARLQLR
jgi:hypothetical protein